MMLNAFTRARHVHVHDLHPSVAVREQSFTCSVRAVAQNLKGRKGADDGEGLPAARADISAARGIGACRHIHTQRLRR